MRRFFAGLLFAILAMILAESVTSEDGYAQQRPGPQHIAYDVGVWGLPMQPSLRVTEYSQPFIYSLWWSEIASCEGFPVPDSAEQATVQFFSVPSSYFALGQMRGMLAGTYAHEPSIYMGAPYVWDEGIVKHEMLHVILGWAGYEFQNFHPAEFFERCGIHILAPTHN